jgi:hypothetical protein
MVLGRKGVRITLAAFFASGALLLALLAPPVWAQGRQEEKRSAEPPRRVTEGQRERIERLSDAQAEEQLVQAAQQSNAAGDLNGEPATAEEGRAPAEVDRIVIEDAENCDVSNNATISFQETTGDEEVGVISNGDGAIIDPRRDRIVITGDPSGDDIGFVAGDLAPGPLVVLSSSGIDCDGDGDDGFDDDLLLLLLLELLEDLDDNDNDDNDNDNDNDDDNDGIDDDLEDAENNLNDLDDEITNGEDTFGFDDDDNDDDGVSATSDEDGAEASTPGARAQAGGDADELSPERSVRGDVVDEIPTQGPLPNTGGASLWAYALPALGALLLGAALLGRFRR